MNVYCSEGYVVLEFFEHLIRLIVYRLGLLPYVFYLSPKLVWNASRSLLVIILSRYR